MKSSHRFAKFVLRGFSITELMVVLVLASVVIAGVMRTYTIMNRGYTRVRLVVDTQSAGNIGFFLIGRDVRKAGSNPSGALGFTAGAPIPFGVATATKLQIYSDDNGDGDVLDEDEDVTYQYVDNDAALTGNDTITRTSSTGAVTFVTNVYNFALSYILVDDTETSAPTNLLEIRMVRVKLTVGSTQRDPQTGLIIKRNYETLLGLRNFQ
jgi:prepilin-type N-terminal cleavage/methylation domain-containing protein